MTTIETSKEFLLKPLSTVTGIVEKRHTMPVLSNVLIEQTSSTLKMLGTDLEIQVTTTEPTQNTGNARFTTSAKKLQDILKALPDFQPIKLELDNNKLLIKSGKSRFNLHTLPADDLPTLEINPNVVSSFTVSQNQFKNLLYKIQFSMANQDIRYYLNGLFLNVSAGSLKLVATDGHRLAYIDSTLVGDITPCEAIIPRKTIVELSKLLNDSNEALHIQICANQIRFNFGNIELISKVIEGKFPDYNRVIPTNNKKVISLNRSVLTHALQRVSILSNEKFRGIRVMLQDNILKIQAANSEQEEAIEELDIDYKDEPLDIGFNITYLLDFLTHGDTENISIALSDGNGSALISEPENENFRYVVMPMRI